MRLSAWLMLGIATVAMVSSAWAAETIVGEKQQQNLEISIYNNNLALVKDTRNVALKQGINEVAFEGVASSIKPETALISADGIKVLEQNYDYDLLSANNITDKSVGQKVKTVMINPTTGENIFDEAEIVSATYGLPILKFSYGIETNFPGRLVFEKLPTSLRSEPTLIAKIDSRSAENKDVSLAYLTNGIGWKTNYVAQVVDDNKLNLTGWVTINNESGIDYKNARVQLIAGDVNQVATAVTARPIMLAKSARAVNDYAVAEGASIAPESISGYHLYNLPMATDIKDKQTKQVSLLEKENVSYQKEAYFSSPLYFNYNSKAHFEQMHPDMIYVLHNEKSANLGIPLPSGIVRFYENDSEKSLQFVGEDRISHAAEGEKMRLNLGKYFNVYANGKVAEVNKLSETKEQDGTCSVLKTLYAYDVEVDFHNADKKAQEIVFSQRIDTDSKISDENVNGKLKDASTYEWKISVPANGEQKLTFRVTAVHENRNCR